MPLEQLITAVVVTVWVLAAVVVLRRRRPRREERRSRPTSRPAGAGRDAVPSDHRAHRPAAGRRAGGGPGLAHRGRPPAAAPAGRDPAPPRRPAGRRSARHCATTRCAPGRCLAGLCTPWPLRRRRRLRRLPCQLSGTVSAHMTPKPSPKPHGSRASGARPGWVAAPLGASRRSWARSRWSWAGSALLGIRAAAPRPRPVPEAAAAPAHVEPTAPPSTTVAAYPVILGAAGVQVQVPSGTVITFTAVGRCWLEAADGTGNVAFQGILLPGATRSLRVADVLSARGRQRPGGAADGRRAPPPCPLSVPTRSTSPSPPTPPPDRQGWRRLDPVLCSERGPQPQDPSKNRDGRKACPERDLNPQALSGSSV